MPKLKIDDREVEVPPGQTVLAAARKLGIDVPTLCFLEGSPPSTSCLVCVVKIRGRKGLVPACATQAVDGMEIESDTHEVHAARKTALELLLSDHVGDCLAPCYFSCAAHMDIPLMLRQISADKLPEAIVTVKNDIALPAVLGRICTKPCEKACRRKSADAAVTICSLKRYVADVDLASADPYRPECKPATGNRVAIVGAGPTGLSAAYYLARAGHAAVIFDDQPDPGGRLRRETTEDELPREVLDAEIAQVTRLGVEINQNSRVGDNPSIDSLAADFDAVLIACGAIDKEAVGGWGLAANARGIEVDRASYQTGRVGLFAAGGAIRTKCSVVKSVADGKEAAVAIDQHLTGQTVTGPDKLFSSRMGKVTSDEVSRFLEGASEAPRRDPFADSGDFTQAAAAEQADRCMHCDCRSRGDCKLEHYGAKYGADPGRYGGQRAEFQQDLRHAEVIYEPGKCIDCGLCIEIAAAAGEPLGLSFVGRGFDVRVGVPFDRSVAEALSRVAAQCAAACPTAALALKQETDRRKSPIVDQD